MQGQQVEGYEFAPRQAPVPQVHLIRFGCATLLLMFGALLARISQACTVFGVLWVGDATVRSLARAIAQMREAQPLSRNAPNWERSLLRMGPNIIIGVGGSLIMLWALLGIGGALIWLVLHGYGLLLMLLAVLIGVLVGGRRAKVGQHLPPQDRLN